MEKLAGWKAKGGSKYHQRASVPLWIKGNKRFAVSCLRGLIETDGSIYQDRGYTMVNFVTVIPEPADDVLNLIMKLGFKAHLYRVNQGKKIKYTIRLSKDTDRFIEIFKLSKD